MVTEDITCADSLQGYPVPVIVAGIATGTQDSHQSVVPSAHRPAGTQHVGLHMHIARSKGLEQQCSHTLALLLATAAGTVKE